MVLAFVAGSTATDEQRAGEKDDDSQGRANLVHEKLRKRREADRWNGRPRSLSDAQNYLLEGPALVGLPLPQPTTDTTLRARTRATMTRFMGNSWVR